MIWELNQSEASPFDKYGLGGFLKRLETERAGAGGPLKGFTFFEDGMHMLDLSRQIEASVLQAGGPAPLYVGFQNAAKLAGETKRYRRIHKHGVSVYAYGEGSPTDEAIATVDQWCRLEANHKRLENQWFLVTTAPEMIAFVGWEVSDQALWGNFGISTPGKQFVGFVSTDERVVQAIIGHLEGVRTGRGASAVEIRWATEVLIDRLQPKRVLTFVDDGNLPYLSRGLDHVREGCLRAGSGLYLYDLTSGSYFSSPYPQENENEWHHPLQAEALRAFGRDYMADLVEQSQRRGVETSAILPFGVGFGHLAKWCQEQQIDLVVLPGEFARPSLFQSLQGYTIDALRTKVHVTILIDDPEHGAKVVGDKGIDAGLVDRT